MLIRRYLLKTNFTALAFASYKYYFANYVNQKKLRSSYENFSKMKMTGDETSKALLNLDRGFTILIC